MALIRRLAGRRRRMGREATARASVIGPDEEPVVVFGNEGARRVEKKMSRPSALIPTAPGFWMPEKNPCWPARLAGTRGDQLRAAIDVLVHVVPIVSVAMHQRVVSREDGPAIVGL